MRFEVLAGDLDGTLAQEGIVEGSTIAALEQLRASVRRAVMVTGREIDELRQVFSRTDLFHVIVAENGGVIYTPAKGEFKSLHRRKMFM